MASGDEPFCPCNIPRDPPEDQCSPRNPYVSIRKLVALLEDPMSLHLYDRHAMILDDFLRACSYAYWVRDLPFIMRALELLSERLDKTPLYEPRLELMLSICAIPPMLTKISESLEYMSDLQEYFSVLGYLLLYLQDKKLQDLIMRAVWSLLERKAPVGICCVKLAMCQNAVEDSTLPETIAQLFEIADDTFYVKLLKLAIHLAGHSDGVCQKMVQNKAIDFLFLRFDPSWKIRDPETPPHDPMHQKPIPDYEDTCKLLWILLNGCKTADDVFLASIQGPSKNSLWGCRCAFRLLTKKKQAELNRNNLFAIILQCLELFPKMPFFQSGLAGDIAILSVLTEVGTSGGTWASEVRLTNSDLDYQFKKLLLLGLSYFRKYQSTIVLLEKHRIISALLRLTTPNLTISWNKQQHCSLIIQSLNVLASIVPLAPTDFISGGGPIRLLMIIELFTLDAFEIDVLEAALKSLYFIAAAGIKKIKEIFDENFAAEILIRICINCLQYPVLTVIIQKCLIFGFCALQLLIKDLTQIPSTAVELCIKTMKRYLNPNEEDPILDTKLIICVIDFLWESIPFYTENFNHFLNSSGIYILLDVIERSSFPVKLVALGALIDCLNDGTCVPHLITWTGKRKNLRPMLLEIFRDENVKLGVKSTPRGAISDIELPLMGEQQWYETFCEIKDTRNSPAIVDLLASCRPKVYSILQLLNYQHHERVSIANEHYCTFNDELSADDQITLLLAENFLGLKLGEVWIELERDLEHAGIRPLGFDGEIIQVLINRHRKWAMHIKRIQDEIVKDEKENEARNERSLYNLLKTSKLAPSLEALHELEYLARTTERVFRFTQKIKQRSELDRTLKFSSNLHEDRHYTCMHDINVNPVFEQFINIESNVIDSHKSKMDLTGSVHENLEINEDESSSMSFKFENESK